MRWVLQQKDEVTLNQYTLNKLGDHSHKRSPFFNLVSPLEEADETVVIFIAKDGLSASAVSGGWVED